MDILLRYWSPKHEEVWTVYYTSLFFGHAEGELVATRMYKKMLEDGIPVRRLATLVRDGPNVNKTVFHKMDKFIREDYSEFPGLVDLGTCSLHTVHNAFNKGMDQMMLETVTAKQKEAMAKLDQIQEQRKAFRAKTHRLLDEILPSKQVTQKKRSSETEKEGKRVKRK